MYQKGGGRFQRYPACTGDLHLFAQGNKVVMCKNSGPSLRPPLKIMLFLVDRPDELIRPRKKIVVFRFHYQQRIG